MDRERGSLCPSDSHPRAGAANGDGPAPIVGVGVGCARRSYRLAVGCTLCTLVVAMLVGVARPVGASVGSTSLVLISQSPWVTPAQPSFDLKLRPVGAAAAPISLGVSVSVYACLSSVSAFDQSLSAAGPSGSPITTTRSPLSVAGLPPVSGGGFDLSMPVTVGQSAPPSTTGFTIDLSTAGGQCQAYPSGVYPVRIQLVDTASGSVVAGLTTHLIYTDNRGTTDKLRFALVLPVATTLVPAVGVTSQQLRARPSAALETPSVAAATAVSGTVSAITDHRAVPLSVAADPLTISALAASGRQSVVDQLADLAAAPSPQQWVSTPFAPVDATDLVSSGLDSELAQQVSRGATVLSTDVTHTAPPSATTGTGLGVWVADDALDLATLAQLRSDGYRQLILPASDVPAAPTNGSSAVPFAVDVPGGSPLTVVASDIDLDSRFTAAAGNPVLAASQLVAELAQIYYEKPNDTTTRAVVAVAPSNWPDNPKFVDTLLGALQGNPLIDPVTTDELFASMATGTCRGTCRLTAASGPSGLPLGAIRTQRQRIAGFTSATTTANARAITSQLSDLVLAGESEALRPDQQANVLHNTAAALDAQLDQLAVAGDQTITLTSQQGTLPVDLVSTAPYPVTASLTVTSDKLLFPNDATQWTRPGPVLLRSGTNIFDVPVRARTSGLFTVDVALHAPTSGLALTTGQVSVRSTATSVVGVVLSLGAVAVLAVWWVRTSRKRRRKRQVDESEAEADQPFDEPTPVGDPP